MRKWHIVLLFAFLVALSIALAGCAPGPNSSVNTFAADGTVAGFWLGLGHGLIAPITFIISLLDPAHVHFYEVHNNGGWYNLGFVLGADILVGGGLFSIHLKSSKEKE